MADPNTDLKDLVEAAKNRTANLLAGLGIRQSFTVEIKPFRDYRADCLGLIKAGTEANPVIWINAALMQMMEDNLCGFWDGRRNGKCCATRRPIGVLFAHRKNSERNGAGACLNRRSTTLNSSLIEIAGAHFVDGLDHGGITRQAEVHELLQVMVAMVFETDPNLRASHVHIIQMKDDERKILGELLKDTRHNDGSARIPFRHLNDRLFHIAQIERRSCGLDFSGHGSLLIAATPDIIESICRSVKHHSRLIPNRSIMNLLDGSYTFFRKVS